MCEATRQLAKAAYELRIQRGNGVIDLGKLERLLTGPGCLEHLGLGSAMEEHQERT